MQSTTSPYGIHNSRKYASVISGRSSAAGNGSVNCSGNGSGSSSGSGSGWDSNAGAGGTTTDGVDDDVVVIVEEFVGMSYSTTLFVAL